MMHQQSAAREGAHVLHLFRGIPAARHRSGEIADLMALVFILLYLATASSALPCLLPNGFEDVVRAKRFIPDQEVRGNAIVLDSNSTLAPFSCHNWRISEQLIYQSVCTAKNWGDNASRPYLMVEFWRFADKEKNVTDLDFLRLVTSAVPSSLVDKGNATAVASKLQTDTNAADYGRSYHQVLLEAVSDHIPNKGWDIFIANLDTRVVPKYRLRISCIARNDPRHNHIPCPDPLGTGGCSGRGKCVPNPYQPKAPVPLSYCNCSRGWGDYGCHRPVAPLSAASVSIPAGTWLYYSAEVGVENVTKTTQHFELLATLQQRVVKHTWDVILCMKPYHGDPERGYDHNVPALPDLGKYCDLGSYFMFKLQSFMVFSRAAVTDNRYYVAVYHRNFGRDTEAGSLLNQEKRIARPNPTPALVSITSQVVELNSDTLPASSFVCPFNCNSEGTCHEIEVDAASVRSPSHPLPFTCDCGNGYGDTLCDATQMVALLNPEELNHIVKFDVPPNGWVSIIVQIPDPNAVVNLQDIQVGFTAPCCSAGYLRVDPPNHTPYQDPLLSTNTYPPRSLDRAFVTNVTYITNAFLPFSSLPQYWKMPGFRERIQEANDGILGTISVYNDAFYNPSKAAVMPTQLTFYLNIVSNQSQVVREQPFIPVAASGGAKYSQYEVVVISVSCSAVFVGVALFMYNRLMWRQRLAHRQRQAVIRTREVTAFRNPRLLLGEEEPPRGTPKEVIDALPCVKYKRPNKSRSRRSKELMDMLTTDVEEKWEGSSIARDDSDMCLVCLDLFRNNEAVRQLPCTHQFHKQCIDTWLAAHTTCPTCRDDVLEPRCIFQGEDEIPLVVMDSVGGHTAASAPVASLTGTRTALSVAETEGQTTEDEDILDALSLTSRTQSGNSELLDRSHAASSPLSSMLISTVHTNVADDAAGHDQLRGTVSGRLRLTGRWLEQFTGGGSIPTVGSRGSLQDLEGTPQSTPLGRRQSSTPKGGSRRFLPLAFSNGPPDSQPPTPGKHPIDMQCNSSVLQDAAIAPTTAARSSSVGPMTKPAAVQRDDSSHPATAMPTLTNSSTRQETKNPFVSPFATGPRRHSAGSLPVQRTASHSTQQRHEPSIRGSRRSAGGHEHVGRGSGERGTGGGERRHSAERGPGTRDSRGTAEHGTGPADVPFWNEHRGSNGASKK